MEKRKVAGKREWSEVRFSCSCERQQTMPVLDILITIVKERKKRDGCVFGALPED